MVRIRSNTRAVLLMRYGAGTIKYKGYFRIDRNSRKIMTMNKELHARSDVARIYVPRNTGGRDLISCESFVKLYKPKIDYSKLS